MHDVNYHDIARTCIDCMDGGEDADNEEAEERCRAGGRGTSNAPASSGCPTAASVCGSTSKPSPAPACEKVAQTVFYSVASAEVYIASSPVSPCTATSPSECSSSLYSSSSSASSSSSSSSSSSQATDSSATPTKPKKVSTFQAISAWIRIPIRRLWCGGGGDRSAEMCSGHAATHSDSDVKLTNYECQVPPLQHGASWVPTNRPNRIKVKTSEVGWKDIDPNKSLRRRW